MVVDVRLRGVVRWVAADVRRARPLVHADVVDLHNRGELHRRQVDGLPIACENEGTTPSAPSGTVQ